MTLNFQQLVLQHKGNKSYAQVSAAAGGTPSTKALQAIVKYGFKRLPDADTLTGVSRAFGINTRELLLAAARTIGLDVDDADTNLERPGTPEPEEQIYYWRKHAEHYKARALGATATVTGNRGGHAHARR
jgi:hypothetical protein